MSNWDELEALGRALDMEQRELKDVLHVARNASGFRHDYYSHDLVDIDVSSIKFRNRRTTINYQNPREASSRSRIFLISLVYVCVCMYLFVYLFVSRLLATLTTIQT